MAEIEYIITNGTYGDTEQGFEPITTNGTVQEQAAAAGGVSIPVIMHHRLRRKYEEIYINSDI